MTNFLLQWTAAACVISAAGCASYPRTAKLPRYDLAAGYRFEQLPRDRAGAPGRNSDDIFVVLAFSGGGTRAGALSYGVLRELQRVKFYWDDASRAPVECAPADSEQCRAKERSLLDEVDVISSVSGGSFTAAYYALNGARIFDPADPFHTNFLYHPVQRDLFAEAVYYPQNWRHLRSRPELAAKLYARHLFGDATFDALRTRPRPYLILNATDMATGSRFEFTQEQMDLLCADLSTVPIARGVAASSAFPGLLNSMTIDSHAAEECGYSGPGTQPNDWVSLALKDDPRTERYQAATSVKAYRDPARRHLHLLDGGLADNIGARAILRGLGSTDRPVQRAGASNNPVLGGWSALSLINQGRTKTVLVIVVNARTNRTKDWDKRAAGPGTFSVVDVASGVPMGNFSRETLGRVRDLVKASIPNLNEPGAPALFGLEVSFDNLPSEDERVFFGNLGTNFDLDSYEVDCLIDRGGSLLRTAPLIESSMGSFADFVRTRLLGRIDAPTGTPPACTASKAKEHLHVRNHYLDIGFTGGIAIPGSDDLASSRFAPGIAVRATRPHGLGVMIDVGRQSFSVENDVGGRRIDLGTLRLWSVLGGVGYTTVTGRTETTFGVSAGYGFGGFSVSSEAGEAYGRAGIFGLDGDASNAWLVKPQATFWYNLSDRWAATVSGSYILTRPTVRITAESGVPYDQPVNAAVFRVGAGIGFKVF